MQDELGVGGLQEEEVFEVGRYVVSRLKEGGRDVRGRYNREVEVLEVIVKRR